MPARRTLEFTAETRAGERSLWGDLSGVALQQDWLRVGSYSARFLHSGDASRPALLLLGGVGDIAESYVGVLGRLGAAFSTYALDFLGCGYTDAPADVYDAFAGATFIADFLDAIGAQRASVIATGLGTWYALRFAIGHPDRVARLVLIAPHAGPGYHFPIVNARSQAAREAAAAKPTIAGVREVLERRIRDHTQIPDDLVLARLDALRQPNAARAIATQAFYLDEAAHTRNQVRADELVHLCRPTLWMLCDPSDEARHKLEPNLAATVDYATLVELHGVGAWPYWEAPAQFSSLVLPFLLGEPGAIAAPRQADRNTDGRRAVEHEDGLGCASLEMHSPEICLAAQTLDARQRTCGPPTYRACSSSS